MANINITRKSFEEAIDALLNAHSQNSNKGKLLKEWFENSFNTSATVSHIKEDKQIGNRVAEQFKHKLPIVVFVCDEEVNRSTLINKIREATYVELSTVLVMSSDTPHVYETLLSNEENDFVNWAYSQLEITMVPLESLSDEAKQREHDFREYLVNIVGNKRENLDNSLAHLNRTFVKDILRQYTGKPFIYETTDTDVLELVLTKVRKTKADQDGNRNSSSRISRYINFLKNDMEMSSSKDECDNMPCQLIFYGAPGTGKSHRINEITSRFPNTIRTTFHPDSDYSTFVGAYKPTMGLLPICDELGQPMKIGSTVLHKEQIIYEFVDQAFLQAYVKAWKFYAENKAAKKQYLIIEEINRGNCAQIFGDLFQLLDRNDYGFSVYPINADKDMKKQLEKAFKGVNIDNADSINQHYKGRNVVKEVLDGDILLLPNNLYIWATMNTSDQSLFPIDSAFKRRWEWQYMPIGKGYDENGQEIKWAIEGASQKFDWWSFLEKINAQVGEATQSEDKKLGFFFCKATDGIISAEKFVGKVIFYLWNDVFKNNGFEGSIFKDVDGTELSFGKFYKSDMKGNAIVQKDKVELFLNNLGVEAAESIQNVDREEETSAPVGTKEKVLLFWQGFNSARSNNQEYCTLYNERKPSAQTFMDLSFGSSDYWPTMNAVITKSIIRCGIWIGVSSNKDAIYSKLKSNETAINELVGLTMTFTENAKTCSIMAEKHIDLSNESNWPEAYTWLMNIAVKIKK